jgi:hypothetical protein
MQKRNINNDFDEFTINHNKRMNLEGIIQNGHMPEE